MLESGDPILLPKRVDVYTTQKKDDVNSEMEGI